MTITTEMKQAIEEEAGKDPVRVESPGHAYRLHPRPRGRVPQAVHAGRDRPFRPLALRGGSSVPSHENPRPPAVRRPSAHHHRRPGGGGRAPQPDHRVDQHRQRPTALPGDPGHGPRAQPLHREETVRRRWGGVLAEDIGELDIDGKPVTQYGADVHMHRNATGRPALRGDTYPLEMPQGISVFENGDAPRLPLIGLRKSS